MNQIAVVPGEFDCYCAPCFETTNPRVVGVAGRCSVTDFVEFYAGPRRR
ncbi:MAG: hypothetical protein JWN03_8454 [Nocardia sp.]|nr:hypothetical protein [Nocardia sp.]